MRRSLVLALPALAGCHYLVEPGYVNSARLQGLGGGSLSVRTGTGDFRDGQTPAAVDVAVRGEAATSGSSVAVGLDTTFAPTADWKHEDSVYARPGIWILPARWGPARDAFVLEPSVDVGWLSQQSDLSQAHGVRGDRRSRRLRRASGRLRAGADLDPVRRVRDGAIVHDPALTRAPARAPDRLPLGSCGGNHGPARHACQTTPAK